MVTVLTVYSHCYFCLFRQKLIKSYFSFNNIMNTLAKGNDFVAILLPMFAMSTLLLAHPVCLSVCKILHSGKTIRPTNTGLLIGIRCQTNYHGY